MIVFLFIYLTNACISVWLLIFPHLWMTKPSLHVYLYQAFQLYLKKYMFRKMNSSLQPFILNLSNFIYIEKKTIQIKYQYRKLNNFKWNMKTKLVEIFLKFNLTMLQYFLICQKWNEKNILQTYGFPLKIFLLHVFSHRKFFYCKVYLKQNMIHDMPFNEDCIIQKTMKHVVWW